MVMDPMDPERSVAVSLAARLMYVRLVGFRLVLNSLVSIEEIDYARHDLAEKEECSLATTECFHHVVASQMQDVRFDSPLVCQAIDRRRATVNHFFSGHGSCTLPELL